MEITILKEVKMRLKLLKLNKDEKMDEKPKL